MSTMESLGPHLDQFREAISQAGLSPPNDIIPDGKIHRFASDGRRGDDAGWYAFHNYDGIAVGVYGDWRTGIEQQTWCSRALGRMTEAERVAYRKRMDGITRLRKEEDQRRHAQAATQAAEIWAAARPAPHNHHGYLAKKHIKPHDARVCETSPYVGWLVVPLQDADGRLHSLEFISVDGDKRFLHGGRKQGCFFTLGTMKDVDVVCLVEGFATGASVHEATGYAVAVAFDAGNLSPVATELRAMYPQATILICGDHDKNGVGQEKARETAAAVNGLVAIPDGDGDDWNDVAIRKGLEAVRAQLTSVLSAPSVLDIVYAFLGRFVAYPSEDAHVAHTLWTAHTHFMDAWESTPRIAFLSPEPGSGKTRALEVTETLVPRPVEAVNATPAYLFRKVSDQAGLPTVLFDEIDCIFGPKAKEHEEIRGFLNAGHRRGAKAGRCVIRGKTVETEELEAFCAVAVAGLGNLPDTILTRSIIIRMRRRAPSEQVEPYRRRSHAPEGYKLRDRLAAWAAGLRRPLPCPDMPDGITDRPADVWEALLAVAEAAGGEWPTRARVAAVALVADARGDRGSLGVRLLADLRTVFGESPAMATADILCALIAMDEAPWGDLKGKPLDSRKLANFLKPYGVQSKNVRIGSDIVKGYAREDLFDPWQRYLAPSPNGSATSATPATETESPEPEAEECPDLFVEDDDAA